MISIPDKPNYQAWKINLLELNEFWKLEPNKQLLYFCSLANLSANSHNTQPARFAIDSKEPSITIHLNRQSVLCASDVAGRQAIISIGCALEYILLLSKYYGYKTSFELLASDKEKVKTWQEGQNIFVPIIKIVFFAKTVPDPNLKSLTKSILERKLIRSEYDPSKKIPEQVIKKLSGLADGEKIKLHLITDSLRRLAISEFQAQADGYVINSRKFSHELGEWLLPNNTDSYVGMPGIGFGLQDDQALRLHKGLLGEGPLEPEDGLRFAQGGKIGLEKAPLIGFITAKKDNIEHWLLAGQILSRSLLELTNNNIQTAIHAGIVEVPMIKQMFSISLGTLRPITALFRAGFVKNENDLLRPVSPRFPIESLLIN
ncbi:MAG: hypothetical protein COU31_00330 [Candidatus Magasanikbacteria bacterium CG10_big_fil_rev_8_21_14_0_10_40_10]|uniref:Nitroreductase domain-containing protein n=1 Tax=Candidatus Magasanikbacteria bacterium CG10_big_fil_rev_8_21_14_0_10_40_10 TaxID=1974648 RepID=A0A2M6W558_9BACT|nr:MAG: hypothetical protein COU31_00330 [Candidatus Magasanikbacteria bacterium CG10_big_fil_rev_8_21_14_0_10_40_10]